MAYTITRSQIDPKIRHTYINQYLTQLKEALNNPVLSEDDRKKIQQRIQEINKRK